MSDLDKKLREIRLHPDEFHIKLGDFPEAVAQIKQAFKGDPNWVEYGVMPSRLMW